MTEKRGTTFVTCFVKIYENEPHPDKNMAWRIENFTYLASTGIQLYVYCDEFTQPYLQEATQFFPHVKLCPFAYQETFVYQACMNPALKLPEKRHETKDTREYLALMNTKIEFLKDAIQKNPFDSRYFSWIDFSVAYMLNYKNESFHLLKEIAGKEWENTLVIPGCWDPVIPPTNHYWSILKAIHWRFCGTFFIGDADSIQNFIDLYYKHFPQFLQEEQTLIWEVNFWGWLEANTEWKPRWVLSGHADNIFQIPG